MLGANVDSPSQVQDAAFWRSNFFRMSCAFVVCEGMVVTPMGFGTSLLDTHVATVGHAAGAPLGMLAALLVAPPLVEALGSRRGLILGEVFNTLSLALFAVATLLPAGSAGQWVANLSCSLVSAAGSGLLWTSFGVFLVASVMRISLISGEGCIAVSADLAGSFGSMLLLAEFVAKSSVSLFRGQFLQFRLFEPILSLHEVFWLFALFGAIMTYLQRFCVQPPKAQVGTRITAPCGKMRKAFDVWPLPGIWLLGVMNVLFGFSAGYLNGYVDGAFVKNSPTFGVASLGSLGALTCFVGIATSKLGAKCSVLFGKGSMMAIGSLSFFAIPTFVFVAKPGPSNGYLGGGLIALFVLQGVGRGVFESTNKAVVADYFPEKLSAGVFGNMKMQQSLGFFGSFLMQSVVKDAHILGFVVIGLSMLVMPCYALAWKLRRESSSDDSHDVLST